MSGERSTVIPCAAVVLQQDDRVLLSRRFNTGYQDGKLSLVAGHIENAEHPVAAAIREANEEIGVTIPSDDMKLVHTSHQICDGNDRLNLYFSCDTWQGEIVNNEPDKCSELVWEDIANLPKDCVPYISFVLGKIANGEMYSEYRGDI